MLKWRAKRTSFVGTWPMWAMALALGSTLMGILIGGSHTPSLDDHHPLKAHPWLDLNAFLQRPEGVRGFASCFISTIADLKSIEWSDGKMDVDLDLPGSPCGDCRGVVHKMHEQRPPWRRG